MSRTTCVPLNFILSRGQQIKVVSQLHRKCRDLDFLIPTLKINKGGMDTDEEGFQGAYVLDPVVGYYKEPISTLDFASLYPSIMICHNLCYSTLIQKDQIKFYSKEDYIMTPNGDYFVKPSVRRGILPIILEELLAARKKNQRRIKKCQRKRAKGSS